MVRKRNSVNETNRSMMFMLFVMFKIFKKVYNYEMVITVIVTSRFGFTLSLTSEINVCFITIDGFCKQSIPYLIVTKFKYSSRYNIVFNIINLIR